MGRLCRDEGLSTAMSMREFVQKVDLYAAFAEFIGTFLFQFFGGAAVANSVDHGLGAAALGNGIALAVLIYATGSISGGHLNPAVSTAFRVTERISTENYIAYIIAQFVGAICGAGFLRLCLPKSAHAFVTAGVMSSQHPMVTLLWEFFMTFALVFVIFAVAFNKDLKSTAPLAIGFTLLVGVFAGGPFTGASLNPARTMGPAFAFGLFKDIWVYLIATFLGGAVGGLVYEKVFLQGTSEQYNSVDEPSASA